MEPGTILNSQKNPEQKKQKQLGIANLKIYYTAAVTKE